MPEDLVGTVLASRYQIEKQLGEGGIGVVFRARHIRHGRQFAIKVLRRRLTSDPKVVARFEREAELAGRLAHPNVVPVVDTGETDDGLHYLVMDYVNGPSLGELLGDGPMGHRRVLELGRQMCDGLAHAHGLGLVHRDFKPENVLVGRDDRKCEQARITDFGVAILREEGEPSGENKRITTAGMVVGTPHYMSPEQARGDAIDHRSDLFALGLILYEMLAGRAPFDGSGVDVARANLLSPTPPIGIRAPGIDVDPRFEALVHRLLEKDPAARPQTATEVRELLAAIEQQPAPAPGRKKEPEPEPVAVADKRRRRWIPVAAIAAIALLLIWFAVPGSSTSTSTSTSTIASSEPSVMPNPVSGPAPRNRLPDPAPRTPLPAPASRSPSPISDPASRTPNPPPKPTAPKPAPAKSPPSPSELASLYASVGRELRALDAAQSEFATLDLWPRYRWIRINEALVAPPEQREHIAELLDALHRDIVTIRGRDLGGGSSSPPGTGSRQTPKYL